MMKGSKENIDKVDEIIIRKKSSKGSLVSITIAIVMIVIVGTMLYWQVTDIGEDQISYLKDKLANINASFEYKHGFNDCIGYLREFYTQVSNFTSNMDNYRCSIDDGIPRGFYQSVYGIMTDNSKLNYINFKLKM